MFALQGPLLVRGAGREARVLDLTGEPSSTRCASRAAGA